MPASDKYMLKCIVCNEFKRTDSLHLHYQNLILWDDQTEKPSEKKLQELLLQVAKKGKKTPVEESKILHTKYFLDKKLESIPPNSLHERKSSLTPHIDKFFAKKTGPALSVQPENIESEINRHPENLEFSVENWLRHEVRLAKQCR